MAAAMRIKIQSGVPLSSDPTAARLASAGSTMTTTAMVGEPVVRQGTAVVDAAMTIAVGAVGAGVGLSVIAGAPDDSVV